MLAAAFAMHVPSAPSVTAAKPSCLPAGIVIFVSSSPGADGGQVDAEEELLRRRPCARRSAPSDRHPRADRDT